MKRKIMKRKITSRELCFIALFAAIISVVSQLSIPMPYGVPMTLQTFIIPLVGMVLGAKNGMISTVIYLLLGAIGIPVFAGFQGSIASFFGPTGGFLISFPLMAFFAGWGAEKNNKVSLLLGLVLGAISNFVFGIIIFSFVTSSPLHIAFVATTLPFIPTAIIKIFLIFIFGNKIRESILKRGLYI